MSPYGLKKLAQTLQCALEELVTWNRLVPKKNKYVKVDNEGSNLKVLRMV